MAAHADADWHGEVTASDASHWGCGACEREAAVEEIARQGRTSERWRRRWGATAARAHALGGEDAAAMLKQLL
eukprot:8820255-Pyramimonas_sp.AAC.1